MCLTVQQEIQDSVTTKDESWKEELLKPVPPAGEGDDWKEDLIKPVPPSGEGHDWKEDLIKPVPPAGEGHDWKEDLIEPVPPGDYDACAYCQFESSILCGCCICGWCFDAPATYSALPIRMLNPDMMRTMRSGKRSIMMLQWLLLPRFLAACIGLIGFRVEALQFRV